MISFLKKNIYPNFINKPDTYLLGVSIGIIVLYLLSFFTTGWDILVYRHDNLDFTIPMYKLLAETGSFFSSSNTLIPNVMNGVPRAAFPSEYNVVSLLYYFFEPPTAYILNETLIRFIAFFGMFLLLKQHIIQEKKHPDNVSRNIIIIGTALIFALLPYWSNAGASVAGQPFLLYAFLNVLKRDLSYKNWLIFLIFPLYSSLILAGIFVLAMLTSIFVYDWIKSKTVNIYLFIALTLMALLYLGVEYRLVLNMFDPIFTSHRNEFVPKYLDFYDSMKRSSHLFFKGQYHAHSLHQPIILLFVLMTLVVGIMDRVKNKLWLTSFRIWALLLGVILAISIFSGFEDYRLFQPLKEAYPLLTKVQFDRFYFLFPLLWFVLFAVSATIVLKKMKRGLLIIMLFLSMQVIYSYVKQSSEKRRKPVEFQHFYSAKVFSEIKSFLDRPVDSYRVMSIGLNPAVTIYNGFYTLDAYLATYPLEYKHEFRKIIAPELEESKKYTKHFDNWGSRCRLMSTDKNITLNLEQFKQMGGKYIFSAYEVNINNGKNVKFVHKFSDKSSLYNVYVYEVE